MPKKIDLTGKRFGRLIVLNENPIRKNQKIQWDCICDCGNLTTVKGQCLKNGETKSCGCLNTESPNELGKVYGKWKVIKKAPSKNKRAYWTCECECGNIVDVLAQNLRSRTSTSCGCQNRVNLVGQIFGKLTVIKENPIRKNEHVQWDCLCECGNTTTVELGNLKSGAVISCGCVKKSIGEINIEQILKENNIKHVREYFVKINNQKRYYDFALLDEQNNVIRLIEFDGIQHTPGYVNGFFTKEENIKTQQRDKEKNEYAIKNNIPLIRIPYTKRDCIILDDLLEDKYLINNDLPN